MTTRPGIPGALRAALCNCKPVRKAARVLAPDSFIETDLIFPLSNGDVEAQSGVPAAVQTLSDQIATADTGVVSTPEYNKMLSGDLKNALDWVSRTDSNPWRGKPVTVLLDTAGRAGGEPSQFLLRLCLMTFRPHMLPDTEVLLADCGNAIDDAGRLKSEIYQTMLAELMGDLHAAIRQARQGGAAMHETGESVEDILDPARAVALEIALGLPASAAPGRPLPPFFHQLYFWQPQPPEALGADGHPRIGGLIPDFGLPRRMWAAGRLVWHRPLLAAVQAVRTTQVETTTRKVGRSGPLAFVTLRHDIMQGGTLALSEWQELVYCAPLVKGAPAPEVPQAPQGAEAEQPFATDPTLLFRYSALTMNGHRIHYDADYARNTEGYSGLVVHGPLLAQALMLMAAATFGPLARFEYRATAPLISGTPARLCRKGRIFWVASGANTLHLRAEATPA